MPDPQPNPSSQTQRLDAFVSENGVRLNLALDDSRLEQLRCYQHWTLKDLDALSGITEFCEIMCAVEWLQQALSLDLEDMANALHLYDLENLTVRELLLRLGLSTASLEIESDLRTVPEYIQTAYNAFHFQSEYQDDLTATGNLMEQLRDYAAAHAIALVQPYDLLEAAIELRLVLLARGYPTVELDLSLRSQTTLGGVPLDSLSEVIELRVKQTPTRLRVTLCPDTGHSTVLAIPEVDSEFYIGGLDALQMQALETALRERTQAILSHSLTSDETTTLRTLLSDVWATHLVPFPLYSSRSTRDRQQHSQRLQPLATFLRAALWQQFEDLYQRYADHPLTLPAECQQVINAYLQERLENAVYSHGRLAFLAQDVATVIAQDLTEVEYCWTEAQNEAAKADGWLVYDVGHDHFPERDRYRLQAFNQAGRFKTDEQAWLYVVQQSRLDSANLCSQALAFLQSQAPREHRLVWVSAYTHLVQEALQSPKAFHMWLRTLAPFEIIGWQPVPMFLRSLGVQRSSGSGEFVWLYYWDEEEPVPVLGLTVQGQPLAEAPLPTWLVDLNQRLEALAKETNTTLMAWTILHAAGGVPPA